MSLLRLLSAGKSLVGRDDFARRYCDAGAGLLPRFGSKKNPFRTTVKCEPPQVEKRAEVAVTVARNETATPDVRPCDSMGSEGGAERPAPNGRASAQQCELARSESDAPRAKPSRLPDAPSLAMRVLGKLGDGWGQCAAKVGGWFARGSKRAKPAIPEFNKAPLQAELSLASVRVVRNDLSDTDLELVPATTPSKSGEAAGKPKAECQPDKAQLQLPAVTREPERVEASSS